MWEILNVKQCWYSWWSNVCCYLYDCLNSKELCDRLHSPRCNRTYLLMVSDSEVMQVERKWHILLTIFFLLITSGQCMDSKDVKQKERRTLLDLILQVIRDSQQRDKAVSRRCSSGLFTSAQDMKFSSREKPFYVPRLDNSRLIGKLIRFIFRSWWWKHNPHFTVRDSCHWSGLLCMPYLAGLNGTCCIHVDLKTFSCMLKKQDTVSRSLSPHRSNSLWIVCICMQNSYA